MTIDNIKLYCEALYEIVRTENWMKDLFQIENNQLFYAVPVMQGPVSGIVHIPGSKSMTNRALLLAALGEGKSHLRGVLFSDDSRHFLSSLESLGFAMQIDEANCEVVLEGCGGKIPKNEAVIHVGSAGTAARFLTAMLAFSSGTYEIQCSEQMKKRPMLPLFDALISAGAKITYLEEEGHLPIQIVGNQGECEDLDMDITQSTQFLSALMMVASMTGKDMRIHITSEKKDGAYIRITKNMLAQCKVDVDLIQDTYLIRGAQKPILGDYKIEPDVSAACYFYALAAITGGTITVFGVKPELMQGDMKFIYALEKLGCSIKNTEQGIELTGPTGGIYEGLDINMNDFSDQALTMSVVMSYATTASRIRQVGHIRGQECNRMQAIVRELTKAGISCKEEGDDILIEPGVAHAAEIETYDDHRVAMAFSLLGIRTEGIRIFDPKCTRKTFENYFEVFDTLLRSNM